MRKMTPYLVLLVFLLTTPGLCYGASGIKGRVAWSGQVVAGVKIRAYASIADIAESKVLATSAPSDEEGLWQLELPPGQYFLTATDAQGALRPGHYFCYYVASPVSVAAGQYQALGFNLIRVPPEPEPLFGKRSGLKGEVALGDELLAYSYLYVYKDSSGGFKGPAYYIQPMENGRFKLSLAPGEYYLLARKRAKGGRYGPLEIGDTFSYYHGNPVHISAGQVKQVRLQAVERLSILEEAYVGTFQGLRGHILDSRGRAVAGMRVFAYGGQDTTGHPDYFSPPSDAEGVFELRIPVHGTWKILARESFGGPVGENERFGVFTGPSESAVVLTPEQSFQELTIRLNR